MTRLQYGGGPEDVYMTQDAQTGFMKPTGGAQALFYDSSARLTRYTDLTTLTGQPITYITTSDGTDGWALGQIPPFYGPDGVFEMWVSVAGSPPFLLQASNLGSYAGPMLSQLQNLLAAPAPSLRTLTDVDATSLQNGAIGNAVVKLASGLWGSGTVATGGGGGGTGDVTTTTTQTITATKTFTAVQAFNAGVTMKPAAVGSVAEIVQALAGQTANLTEWRDSAGSPRSWVSPAGNIYAPNGGRPIILSKAGALATGIGSFRYYNDSGTTLLIRSIRASIGTPSTSGTPTFDVNVNSTSVFTTQSNRPTIAVGANTSGKVVSFNSGASIPDGAFVSVDVDVAGTGAADAVVQVEVW